MFQIEKAINCTYVIKENNITLTYKNVRDCGCRTNFIFKNGKKYEIEFDFKTDNTNKFSRNIAVDATSLDSSYNTALAGFTGKEANKEQHIKIVTKEIPNDGKQYSLFLNGNNFASGATGYSSFSNFSIKELNSNDNLLDDSENKEETVKPDEPEQDKEENNKEENNTESMLQIKELEQQLVNKEEKIKELEQQLVNKEEKIKELEQQLNSNPDNSININSEEFNSMIKAIEELEEMLYKAQHDLLVLKNSY